MKTTENTNARAEANARPLQPVVVPLTWPDSDGWWWCRQSGNGYIPGDEMCVEVTLQSRFNRNFILWRGESYGMEDGMFRSMEWIKAESPWRNVHGQ